MLSVGIPQVVSIRTFCTLRRGDETFRATALPPQYDLLAATSRVGLIAVGAVVTVPYSTVLNTVESTVPSVEYFTRAPANEPLRYDLVPRIEMLSKGTIEQV